MVDYNGKWSLQGLPGERLLEQLSVRIIAIRNYFALNISDSIIVECLTPVAVISAALNIYFFYRVHSAITQFPNAREPPFDILLFITILSLVNQSVYLATVSRIFINSVYNGVYPPTRANIQYVPDTFNNFCLITGTLRFSSEVGATVYNTIFCLYYTCKIKNPLKGNVSMLCSLGSVKQINTCPLYHHIGAGRCYRVCLQSDRSVCFGRVWTQGGQDFCFHRTDHILSVLFHSCCHICLLSQILEPSW